MNTMHYSCVLILFVVLMSLIEKTVLLQLKQHVHKAVNSSVTVMCLEKAGMVL